VIDPSALSKGRKRREACWPYEWHMERRRLTDQSLKSSVGLPLALMGRPAPLYASAGSPDQWKPAPSKAEAISMQPKAHMDILPRRTL